MSRPYYDDYGGGIPDYYTEQQHQQPAPRPSTHTQSRIPRPEHAAHDRVRGQPPMKPDHYDPSHGRSPRRAQEPYYPDQSAWDASQNLYDGSGYEDEYNQYGQYDQWPLQGQPHMPSPRNSPSPRRPPQRPARPDESPQRQEYRQPVRDQPRSSPQGQRQYHAPTSHHGSGQWTGDGYAYAPPDYPPPNRPLPQSRGPPSGIPQHAPPQMPQQAVYGQANRRPPLGPPPSARRGPAAYYPQVAPVHPIVEETDSMRGSIRTGSAHTNSKNSFASSNAIPIGIPQFYLDNGNARPSTGDQSSIPEDYYDDDSSIDAAAGRRMERLTERDLPREDPPSPEVLVRQASVGKKSKPTLTTVKSSDKVRKSSGSTDGGTGIASLPSQQERRRFQDPEATEAERSRAIAHNQLEGQTMPGAQNNDRSNDQEARNAAAVGAATEYMQQPEPNPPSREGAGSRTPEEVLKSGTGLLDPSSSDESEREVRKKRSKELLGAAIANQLHPDRSRARSPLAPNEDERVKSILESLEKGGAISAKEAEELKAPMGGLSEHRGKRRPPRINVDAVRDAEARGSLTSLPDLIRRATKLASNLDRGKTASRMGMDWFTSAEGAEKRRSGSISDILNSFPPPHNTPPPGSRPDMSRWSSRLRHSALASDSDAGEKGKRRRKCCGMPLWLFIVLLVLLILLVAAAVIVPIMLIVVPRNNDNKQTDSASACEKSLTCQNGGANILSSKGNCECLCINGYSGRTCSNYEGAGCTSTSLGSANNATVGDAIPRLLEDSANNFSMPLDADALLGLFSNSDMTCTSQNALVTFDGKASRKRSFIDIVVPRNPTPTLKKKQADQTTTSATTSDGIVFANGSPTPSSTTTATGSSTAASSTSTAIIDNNRALNFARVAVLYVFQASGDFNKAATSQENLQDYFRQGENNGGATVSSKNITLGAGYSCDLTTLSVILSNGTRVGGTGS